MKVVFAFLVLLVAVVLASATDNYPAPATAAEYVQQTLPGHWKENQYERQNLNNFLYYMGLNWFKRVYVTSASWENEQNIRFNNGKFNIDGIKGPKAEPFDFEVTTNNRTMSDIDLGQLGGLTDATAEIKGYSLMVYLHKRPSGELYVTAERRVDPADRNKMVYVTKHLPSNTAAVYHFHRVAAAGNN